VPRLRLSPARFRLPVSLSFAALSGLLLALANPPTGWWPLAFVALIPLLWVVRGVRPRRGFLLGLVAGFVYFVVLMSWIRLFGWPALLGITLANACYIAIFGVLVPTLWRPRRPLTSMLAIAALWVLLEALRSTWPLGGLTWGDIMYSQVANPGMLRLASITGGWGISFVVVAVNGLALVLAEAVQRRGTQDRGIPAAESATDPRAPGSTRTIVVGALLIGVMLVAPLGIPTPAPDGTPLEVATIQLGETPTSFALAPIRLFGGGGESLQPEQPPTERIEVGRSPTTVASDVDVAERFAELHRGLAEDPPDLIIWPESALDEDPAFVRALGTPTEAAIEAVGVPTIVGARTGTGAEGRRTTSLLYDGTGEIIDRYDKTHLVPFGEVAPFRNVLRPFVKEIALIQPDLVAGTKIEPLLVPGGPSVGSSICFENGWAQIQRDLVAQGAELLVVSTNNASYLQTPASEQHVAMSQIRAAENARWTVHAGLTGITAIIDDRGAIVEQRGLFQEEVLRSTVQRSTSLTLATRFGDWFVWTCAFVVALGFIRPRRRARPRTVAPLPEDARALAVLPTYNEAATIAEVLTRLLELPVRLDIVVVDDDSPDGTGKIVERIAAGGAPIQLIRRAAKAGLASAYVTGFEAGVRQEYDLIVEMDSDLSHQPEELPSLLHAARAGADLAVGARYVPGGSVSNWSRARVALSKAGNGYARLCLGFPLSDSTSGFRVYRSALLQHLMRHGIHADGYGFQIELAYQSWLDGYRVVEVPISFREREHGVSKISRRIVVEALWLVSVWGLRDRLRPDPS